MSEAASEDSVRSMVEKAKIFLEKMETVISAVLVEILKVLLVRAEKKMRHMPLEIGGKMIPVM